MYIFIENQDALIIDPHINKEMKELLNKNHIENITVILTHEHPDHISGLKYLKENYPLKIICTKYSANYLSKENNTRPLLISLIIKEQDEINGTNVLSEFNKYYKTFSIQADITFENELEYNWNNHNILFKAVTGHSKGSCCFTFDKNILFTGDSLMKNIPTIIRFPGGNKDEYLKKTIPIFEKYDKNITVLPGHGDIFKLKELYKKEHLNVGLR